MTPKRIILFDNYDSYTHNLYHLLTVSIPETDIQVCRNTNRQLFSENFDLLVGGPGPCTPNETGVLKELFDKKIIPQQIPYFGVCLGMQFLAWYYGYPIKRSQNPTHGDTILLKHSGTTLFQNLPQKFPVARYNSLEVDVYDLTQSPFEILATEENTNAVMALRHKTLPLYGIQFHPESFITQFGKEILHNFYKQVFSNE